MFQIGKNGTVVLNKTRTLSPKQISTLRGMDSELERNRYLMSIMGLIKGRHYVNRPKAHGHDRLALKGKGTVLSQMRRLQRLDREHVPSDTSLGDWIGVEIECIIPHQPGNGNYDCECLLTDEGDLDVECNYCADGGNGDHWSMDKAHAWLREQLSAAGVSRVSVKQDGSLDDDDGHGVECTILFNTKYGFEPLQRLCKTLLKIGCYVNKTCGLHVHLDVRNLKKSQVARIGQSLGHSLPVIKWLTPESRHANTYCKLSVSPFANRRDDRYHAINLTSFFKFKTIEVRLHSGSINATKIESWVKLLRLIGAAELTTDLKTFQDLIDIGLSEPMIEYAESRITELNPNAWSLLNPAAPVLPPDVQAIVIQNSEPVIYMLLNDVRPDLARI